MNIKRLQLEIDLLTMITHVERAKAMAHAKASFAVDNLKLSPIGEAVAQQLVDGKITPNRAVKVIVANHFRVQADKKARKPYTSMQPDFLAQQA